MARKTIDVATIRPQISADKPQQVIVFPEIVTAFRKDGSQVKVWDVEEGNAERGDAWTSLSERRIRIPLLGDEASRAVRNHELSHARISPSSPERLEAYSKVIGVSWRAVECAEEVRVNAYLTKKGISLDALADGSEKASGEQAGLKATSSVETYNEAICFGVALVGTPGFAKYVGGIRKSNPELATTIKTIESRIKRVLRPLTALEIGRTNVSNVALSTPISPEAGKRGRTRTLGQVEIEMGFGVVTTDIINAFRDYLIIKPEASEYEQVEGSGGVDYQPSQNAGAFAPLILDKSVLCSQQVKGHLAKRKRASNVGTTIGYPDRLLTDPDKRIFRDKKRVGGGVVVIDQSGSMDISEDDLEAILDTAPGALVIGYSNRPGKSEPNAWVLANRGKRVAKGHIPAGKVGNGVDGPVLDYALRHRRGSEPVIWVCDGQVTDFHDHPYTHLSEIVGNIIIKNGIIQAPTVELAVRALRSKSPRSTYQGRVGDYVRKRKNGR